MEISAGIAAQTALTRQAIALETMKMAADMSQQMADILAQALDVPASSSRGTAVNITA